MFLPFCRFYLWRSPNSPRVHPEALWVSTDESTHFLEDVWMCSHLIERLNDNLHPPPPQFIVCGSLIMGGGHRLVCCPPWLSTKQPVKLPFLGLPVCAESVCSHVCVCFCAEWTAMETSSLTQCYLSFSGPTGSLSVKLTVLVCGVAPANVVTDQTKGLPVDAHARTQRALEKKR